MAPLTCSRQMQFGRVSACLAGLLVSNVLLANELPGGLYIHWAVSEHRNTLADASVLTEYQAATSALNRPGLALRVAFVPRFNCLPIISIRQNQFSPPQSDDLASDEPVNDETLALDLSPLPAIGSDNLLAFEIDGDNIPFPVLADMPDSPSTDQLTWFYNGNRQSRETLRLKIDVGDQATIDFGDDRVVTFSLMGSRKSLKGMQTRCRQHVPIPYEN